MPVPVTTMALSEIAFYPVRTAPALAESLNDSRLSAEIGGLLEAIPVRVGDSVKVGDVVARVDCREAEISQEEAEAAFKAAQARYELDVSQLSKARQLSKSKSISADEIDRRASNVLVSGADRERLKAALAKAKLSVDRCAILAPYDAVITERLASVGDYMAPGRPVLRLLDIKHVEVKADVQEKDLASLKAAADYEFVTREASYRVGLRTILPQMDSHLRSFEARFSFIGSPAKSGSAGRLSWRSPIPHLPADLVVDNNGLGVFVFDKGRARFLPLPNAIAGLPAAIEADYSANVIIDGRFNLQDGDPVVVNGK